MPPRRLLSSCEPMPHLTSTTPHNRWSQTPHKPITPRCGAIPNDCCIHQADTSCTQARAAPCRHQAPACCMPQMPEEQHQRGTLHHLALAHTAMHAHTYCDRPTPCHKYARSMERPACSITWQDQGGGGETTRAGLLAPHVWRAPISARENTPNRTMRRRVCTMTGTWNMRCSPGHGLE